MIKQIINVDNYWKIIVYFNVNYNLFNYINKDLLKINISKKKINRIYYNLMHDAKAVTISSFKNKTSIILFNKHKNNSDYINSIIHEAEHVKQHTLIAYKIEDKGEPPAYTIGFIAMKMLKSKVLIKGKVKLL